MLKIHKIYIEQTYLAWIHIKISTFECRLGKKFGNFSNCNTQLLFKIFSALARVISKEESFKTKYLGISISIENFNFPLTLVDLKFLYFFNLVSLVEMKVSSILCLEMQNESILVKAVQIRMPLLVSVESSKKTIILCFLGLLITGDILTV